MGRTLLSILTCIFLSTCSFPKNPSITITYPGYFYAEISNNNKVWIFWEKKEQTWTKYDLRPTFGEWGNIKVTGIKARDSKPVPVPPVYPDLGTLTITIEDTYGIILEQKTAPKGTDEVSATYNF